MSLYNKYRPDSLDKVRGNAEIIGTLSKLLEKKKLPQVILLHGETGCGKTTIARIITSELGCIGFDLQELDFGDLGGVDAVREIKKKAQYKPLQGKCRVWIIDECHRMTKAAQNAFLKILEDTPKHVYFILCTTDPKDLIPAVKGRCSQYQVTTLGEKDMFSLLKKTAKAEGIKVKPEILEFISEQSEGHPRNALQILEQVLNTPEENRMAVAKQAAELKTQAFDLCKILLKGSGASWKQVANILKGLKDQEPESIRRLVLSYMNSVLLNKDSQEAAVVIEEFIEPFYNTGFPGLTFACYSVIKGGEE